MTEGGPGRTQLVLVSNRGPVTFHAGGEPHRGSGGLVTALTGLASHRDVIWIASAMSEDDAEVSEKNGGQAFPVRSTGRRGVPGAPGGERPAGLRLVLQRVREPDAVVHPALPVGPVQRARHPARGDRGIRVRLQRRQRGPRAGRGGGDRGRGGAGGDGPRLPPLHAARPGAPGPPGCVPAPLHPHPVDAVGCLAGAADADPRGDLHRHPGQRHRGVPHPLLPPELPAVLPRPDGPGGGLRARRGEVRRARGVGEGLSAADRPQGHPADRSERCA